MSTEPSAVEQGRQEPEKQDVAVEIFPPRDPEDEREFTFDKHTTVGNAAQEAASAFGYPAGDYTLAKGRDSLDRNKQLVAAGVREGDVLALVNAGGGV